MTQRKTTTTVKAALSKTKMRLSKNNEQKTT
jgi:hypothetical protein